MELEPPNPPIAQLAELTAERTARSWGRATGPRGVYIMSAKCLSVCVHAHVWSSRACCCLCLVPPGGLRG